MKLCYIGFVASLLGAGSAFVPSTIQRNNVKFSTCLLDGPKIGAGGMADTRDPEAYVDADPRKSIKEAPSFEEYLKQRAGGDAAPASAPAAPAPAPAPAASTSAAPPKPKPASYAPGGGKGYNFGSGSGIGSYLNTVGGSGAPAASAPAPAAPAPAATTPAKTKSYAPGGGKGYNFGSGSGIGNYLNTVGGSTSTSTSASPAATAPSLGGPVDYDAVRSELKRIMDNPSWDDGSLAPIFIRLAWHSSGTYDAATGTGGSNGAGMRFSTEAADPENAGLEVARAFLEPVKQKFPGISYSDLWILAAYVGLEHTGGPVISFSSGRTDHPDESYWERNGMTYGRLPAAEKYCCPYTPTDNLSNSLDASGKVIGWEGLCSHVRNEVFYRMGFNDQEIVALLCGGHVYGRCHPNFSGYAGPWVEHPTRFSNEYATDMIEDDWTLVSHEDTWLDEMGASELRPAPGNRQFVNKVRGKLDDDEPNQMMLLSDMVLAWDPSFRSQLEIYAGDEALLKNDFGAAFKKLTELGCGFA